MKQHFEMFAAYNRWANQRVYDAAADLTPEEFNHETGAFFKSAMGTLNHLLVTDRIWMKRFSGLGDAPTALDTILCTDLEKLRQARIAEDWRIIGWIAGLSARDLAGRFTYTTLSEMRTISQRLAPALAHVFNHQTHHRGQMHMIFTALGKPSLSLDLVQFQRTEEGREFV
ncbi:DinB family protein [Mesorhizobium sp. LHD-90]|uniref:DinB family protein n=1 Tax=Mesorhizobium sp. LHD-90 TaxID=3071414 RepID=UPI0027E14E1C|nr:DinB family protein [Mesorhizobium sp. LHD-90]MDQ6434321.1 DinB family protein [Mesorhizobium sp. LHD-90]